MGHWWEPWVELALRPGQRQEQLDAVVVVAAAAADSEDDWHRTPEEVGRVPWK